MSPQKSLFVISALCLLLTLKTTAQDQTFTLPAGIPAGVAFGMPVSAFTQVVDMRTMKSDNTRDWRTVYFQPSSDPDIRALIYYISKEVADQPLYEIIIQYASEELAKTKAVEYFGAPNHSAAEDDPKEEWRFNVPNEFARWVWVYKDKLVLVARVPGTEWDEEWDEN